MSRLNRRTFLQGATAAVAGAALFGTSNVFAGEMKDLLPKKGKRVLVVGAGYGGSTAAKYIKMLNPKIEVILVDQNDRFVSCPMSNLVIGDLWSIDKITFKYDTLVKKYGIKFIKEKAVALEADKKRVVFSTGYLTYDFLVVAPGIGFIYDKEKGFTEEALKKVPHAWKAGEQTVLLAQQLKSLKKGGTVLLRVPKAPYRCPPGPYERASLIANFIKKNNLGAKIMILDANDDVASKGKLFRAAWEDYYKGILEYTPDVDINGLNGAEGKLLTSKGDIFGDVINYIPDQKAADLAFTFGLVPEGKKWATLNGMTYESDIFKDVFIVGDSTFNGNVGPMPKSGYVANSMGKVVAENITSILSGKPVPKPFLANACYSLVNDNEAIWVTAVYEYDEAAKASKQVGKAGGTPEVRTALDKEHAISWAKSIWQDTLM